VATQFPTSVRPTTAAHREPSLVEWFQRVSTARNAYLLLAFAAVGYSIGVAVPLAIAKANPMPDPYLRIAAGDYFFWGTFFYAPVIAAAWLLASGVMYLAGWASGRKSDFSELLRYAAFATGIGTLGTLLSDLVTSPLRALAIINEQVWEQSVQSQGAAFWFLWFFMAAYVVLFCVGYPIAARLATKLSWSRSIAVGITGFVAFQGFEYIFIR
jgi:hypothetical protein